MSRVLAETSPAVQTLSSLALVAGGGVVTMAVNLLADKRARRVAERDARDKAVTEALEEIRSEQRKQALETARLHGRLDERDKKSA